MLLSKIKKYNRFNIECKPAFTIIEALVFLFIFILITTTFYSVYSLGSRYMIDVKSRLGAVSLANEKMEIVRNLAYDSIGTVNGIPNGSLQQDEDVVVNARPYHVKTFIQYVDDPLDGVFPADTVPNDYKAVKITVSWAGYSKSASQVEAVSRFVPPGLEVASGDGILSVNIINSGGAGVPQATVHIVNNDVSPTVNITAETDDTGNLMFPGAKQSIQKYQLTVSKDGYETVSTVDPNSVPYSPIDTHASVVKGAINTKTIVEDLSANLKITSVDGLNNSLPNVDFHIEGGRILGTNFAVPPQNVYNLKEDDSTGANSEKDFNNISPGQFSLSNIGSVSGYTLIGADPISPMSLAPGDTVAAKIKFAKNDLDSLLVRVEKDSDNTPISDAQVHATNGSGYDTTVTTDSDGMAFFPTTSDPFAPGDYNVAITASGFQDNNSTAAVNKFTDTTVKLTAN